MYICQLLLVCTWFYSALLCLSTVVAQDSTASCQFPFIFKEVSYTECTTKDDPEGKLWCSTKTDNQDRHIEQMGHWKHCTVTTRIERIECKTYPDGKVGDCMLIKKCPSLNAILQRHLSGTGNSNELDIIRKSACQHGGKGLGVCCTRTPTKTITRPTTTPTPRPAPTINTLRPPTSNPTGKICGTNYIPDRIVGGTDAKLTAWPWMVLFQAHEKTSCSDNNPSCPGWASSGECENNPSFMNANCKKSCNKCPRGSSNWICGGVLITDQYVLTAAHCFKDNTQVEYARIGEFDLSIDPDTGGGHTAPKPQDIDIERIIKHEQYNTPNCRRCNDIALVKLAKPAQIHTFFVEPVCLPSNPQRDMGFSVSEFQNKLGWATGWGVKEVEDLFTIKQTQILQQVNLTIQELDFCRQRKHNYPDGRMILCAGHEDGGDICRGDSGGPIMLSDSVAQKWYIVGISSFGATVCGDKTAQGIFTSVHFYMDWINENIA